MEYKYYHNAELKAVYRAPVQPQLHEIMDKSKRKIIGWAVSMKIEITRADNVLSGTQWKYPIADYPQQSFENIGNRYDDREIVVSHFHMHHDPNGNEIDENTYLELKTEYEKQARENRNI
jgi:hypothetical protein